MWFRNMQEKEWSQRKVPHIVSKKDRDYWLQASYILASIRCHQDCNLKSNISNLSAKILKISRFSFLQNNFLPKLKNIWNPEPYVLACYQLIFRISQTLNTYTGWPIDIVPCGIRIFDIKGRSKNMNSINLPRRPMLFLDRGRKFFRKN